MGLIMGLATLMGAVVGVPVGALAAVRHARRCQRCATRLPRVCAAHSPSMEFEAALSTAAGRNADAQIRDGRAS